MNLTFHDAIAYEFKRIVPRSAGDDDFKCIIDNTGGRLCIGVFNNEARYYPKGKNIMDENGKAYPFVHLEIKLDNLIVGDKAYDYVKRAYVNYSPTDPSETSRSLAYTHGIDVLRFLAAYDGMIDVSEILVNPNKPLNKPLYVDGKLNKDAKLNYPLVELKSRKDVDLKKLLSLGNSIVVPKTESSRGRQLLSAIEKLEQSIPDNEDYEAYARIFGVVGGIFYKNTDTEGGAIKKGQFYPFNIEPPLEFPGDPSLEDFNRRDYLLKLFENASFYNIPDNNISPRTAILGRLRYLTSKSPKWDLLNGGHIDGEYEWGTTEKHLNDVYFKEAVTVTRNAKLDPEEVDELRPVNVTADRVALIKQIELLIEDLEERDYEFPGNFLTEAVNLEKELLDNGNDISEYVTKYENLKEKIENFKEDVDDEDWAEYQKELKELKILADKALSTKKRSDYATYVNKMRSMEEEFSTTAYMKNIDSRMQNVTFEDARPYHWAELSGSELERRAGEFRLTTTPINLNRPADNEMEVLHENPDLFLDIEDGVLYYGKRAEIMAGEEKESPIPSKIWVWVEKPSSITYTESSDYEVVPGKRNPRNTSGDNPTFDVNIEGPDLWLEYMDFEDPIERSRWYKGLRLPAQRRYLDGQVINQHVVRYNKIDDDLGKIKYLSDLKAKSEKEYKWVIRALGVDLDRFDRVISQYRKPRNVGIDTQLKTMIAQLFGRDVDYLSSELPTKDFDTSAENVEAYQKLEQALEDEENPEKVFLDTKKGDKDYRFLFPNGDVIELNAISGVRALIRIHGIKPLEKVNTLEELKEAIVKYNTSILEVSVIDEEVNGKDHLGVTLTTRRGSIKLTIPNTLELRRLIEEVEKLAEENSKDTFVAPRGEEKRAPRTLKEHLDEHAEDMDPTESYYQERASGGYIIFIKKPEMKDKILLLKNLSDNNKELLVTEYGIEFKEGMYDES